MSQDEQNQSQRERSDRAGENEQERFQRQTLEAKGFPPESYDRKQILWERDNTRKGGYPLSQKILHGAHGVTCETHPKFILSSGSQLQAKLETRSALAVRATEKILRDPAPGNIKYFQRAIAKHVLHDECLKEIGGKIIDSKVVCPVSLDKPVVIEGEDASSLIGTISDDRVEAEASHNLQMLDLEQKYGDIILRTNPDISLLACFLLYSENNYKIKITDVARYFALQHFTRQEFQAFYERVHYHLKSDRVKALLESYMSIMVIIVMYSILMADRIDF